jgi:hypothetical protein
LCPIVFGAFTLLGVYLLLDGAASSRPLYAVLTAAFAAAAIGYPIWSTVQVHKMDRMIAQIQAR